MNVIALPGRRAETEAWLIRLLDAAQYPEAKVTRYRHWESDEDANVGFEAERLSDASPQLVVAKSLGTVIAATAYESHQFRPAYGIFIGTPFAALEEEGVRLLRNFAANVTTLFIQQSEDPGGAAAALATRLQVHRGNVAEVPGSDHLYLDIDALVSIVQQWRTQHPALQPWQPF